VKPAQPAREESKVKLDLRVQRVPRDFRVRLARPVQQVNLELQAKPVPQVKPALPEQSDKPARWDRPEQSDRRDLRVRPVQLARLAQLGQLVRLALPEQPAQWDLLVSLVPHHHWSTTLKLNPFHWTPQQ
jgi:hypothetical protein